MTPRVTFYLFIALGFLYLISPWDIFPEGIAGFIGLIDDVALLVILYWRYSLKVKQYQEQLKFYREKLKSFSEGIGKEKPGAPQQPSDPYDVLEVQRGASDEEIEKAHRKLVALYHPDKVAHLGKELQALAHQKTIQIQQAYDRVKKK